VSRNISGRTIGAMAGGANVHQLATPADVLALGSGPASAGMHAMIDSSDIACCGP
jgi:hypothetical protein